MSRIMADRQRYYSTWRAARDVLRGVNEDVYEKAAEPYRKIIREQCTGLVRPRDLMEAMLPSIKDELEAHMVRAAAYDVYEERVPADHPQRNMLLGIETVQ